MSLPVPRRAVARLVALFFALGCVTPTLAFAPNVEREWRHFAECLPLMFSDPVAHQQLCGPSRHVPSLKSLSEPSVGGSPAVTPPECPMDEPCKPECIPDLPCEPGCLPDFPCPPDNRG